MSGARGMDDAGRAQLLAELERRVRDHEAAGDYALPWLDAVVEEMDPVTPVDRFLQTPPLRRREQVAALGLPAAAGRREEIDRRLRDALAWLALAVGEEARAREGLSHRSRSTETAHRHLDERLAAVEHSLQALTRAQERWAAAQALRARHPGLAAPDAAGAGLSDVEARAFSRNGEDGITLHLLSLIGPGDRRFVEIGAGDGRATHTAILARGLGWSGVVIGSGAEVAEPAARGAVRMLRRPVTPENADDVLVEAAGEGDLDVLSIHTDGDDLGVWDAVRRVSPRLVIIAADRGAPLPALARLGARKGYVLAGCDSTGATAFLARADCAGDVVPAALPPEETS